MVSAVDETIGAIYDALEETGMLDNTLIAFSSDVSSTFKDEALSDCQTCTKFASVLISESALFPLQN